MHERPSKALSRVANWFALVSVVAVLAGLMHLGSPDGAGWWFGALVFVAWVAGPILLAAACASLSRTFSGQATFLIVAVAFASFTAWVYLDILRSTSSTASLGLIFAPFYLYAAWLLIAVAALAMGWRVRDPFDSKTNFEAE